MEGRERKPNILETRILKLKECGQEVSLPFGLGERSSGRRSELFQQGGPAEQVPSP